MSRTWLGQLRFWVLGALLAGTACTGDKESSGDDGECEVGDEGCACYPNKTCNEDLACYSGLCVEDEGDGDKDDGDKTDEGDSDEEGADAAAGDDEESGDDQNPAADDSDGPAANDDPASADDQPASDDDDSAGQSTEPEDDTDGSEQTDSEPEPVPPAETPVGRHGQLHVSGTQLTDEHGAPVQLKGISSMWLNWEPTGYALSLEGLRWMRDEWKLQVFRAAMGVGEQPGDGAYLEDPETAKSKVRTIVQNAVELGVYVIIDWHDHHAESNQAEAEAFFAEMAEEFGDVPNVLYETYNEPLAVDWDTELRPYHEAVSGAIREHDPDNVIILGTPNWSQDVDVAAGNPLVGDNLMYTLHFYACDHTENLRAKAVSALNLGLPIFVTEWGATPADGGSETPTVCEPEATAWHDWMDAEGISWAAWKLDGCSDSSCLFTSRSVPVDGGWTASMLNGHAPFVLSRLNKQSAPEPDEPPANDCEPTGSCVTADRTYCDEEGELQAADCSGCALVLGCSACCENIGYFGARDTTTSFTIDQSLITDFTQSSELVTIQASFTGFDQTAAIAIKLASAVTIDPYSVGLALAADGGDAYVTLENGSAGCLYPLSSLDGVVVLDPGFSTCWDGFVHGDPVTQINVRVDSLGAGDAELAFGGITW